MSTRTIKEFAKRTGVISNAKEMYAFLSADNEAEAKRRLYKATDCGAWIGFHLGGIELGSIVEGADFGTATYALSYPFTGADVDVRIKAIEAEASAIWEWANVLKDRTGRKNWRGKTDAERGVDAPDVDYEYAGLNPSGRSA